MLLPGYLDLPPIPYEFRAAWVATVDNIDWPSRRTLTTEQQRAEITRILDTARAINLNAIVLQVRPSADALYKSSFEPWSEYLTGAQGLAPNPYYDPLEAWVEEAHKRSIELHVWLNPYRAKHPSQKGPVASNHIASTNPEVVKKYGNLLWMDPGSQLVQKRTLSVVRDIVRRYDIDGVHIDDYFYPYPIAGTDFPDEPSYRAYKDSGGRLAKEDWRRNNVNEFVQNLYKSIKSEKRWVKFGISPFGIYRSGIPAGIRSGVDQYAGLYADAKKWLNEGWCDYFTPQLYWAITAKEQSYPVLLNWWQGENTKSRHLWPGLYTSRVIPGEGTWQPKEITDQVKVTRQQLNDPGEVHFSIKAFVNNSRGMARSIASVYTQPAFVPATPWLSDHKPRQVRIKRSEVQYGAEASYKWTVEWAPERDSITYAVCIGGADGKWSSWQPMSKTSISVADPSATLAIVAFNRAGVASEPELVKIERAKRTTETTLPPGA